MKSLEKIFQFLCCIIFLFLFESYAIAQDLPDFKFRTFSPEGGLGNSGVKEIKQDKLGFIWILMQNELFRFDGYTYKRYSNKLIKMNSNSFKWILNSIEEDALGNLYLGTASGLFLFNKKKDNFELLLPDYILKIKRDIQGNMWVLNGTGIYLLDQNKKVLNLIDSRRKTYRSGTTVLYPLKGELIMSKEKGEFYQYDYTRKVFKLFFTLPVISNVADIKKIDNFLWILTEDQGLWMLELNTLKIEQKFTFFCQTGHERVPAKSLFIDKYKNVWIGTQKGLYILNPISGKYTLNTRSDKDFFSLTNNSIQNFNEDLQGNVWIGTYSGGVCYVNFDEVSRFKTISFQSGNLRYNVISGFAENGNEIWFGTEGSGLFSYNKVNNTFKQFKQQENRNSLAYDNVKSLMLENNQHLWIAMYRGGLDRLDLKTGKFQNFSDKDPQKRILENDIYKLEADGDSGIWIGYQNLSAKLTYFSLKNNKSEHYNFDIKGNLQIVGSQIKDFIRDNEDDLWIATIERLHVMNVKTKKNKVVPIDHTSGLDLSTMNIETLFWDKKDRCIWIGTNNNGLIKYDKKSGRFEYFREVLNFKAHSIYSINSDNYDNLWLGTDNGLFKFEKVKKLFFQFNKMDGVQGHIFSPNSSLKSKTGELYFGGTEGFSIINPENIKNSTYKPQIIISDFFIDNNSMTSDVSNSPLTDAISYTSDITLNHNQRNFGFEFSSTNYLIPEKIRFKYRLNGYDNQWIEVDASRRFASYSKVPTGNYTFEIMATNNDGVWSDSVKMVKIKILPAPWNSWWAYLIYFILIGAIIYTILNYYFRLNKLKMEVYWDSVEIKRQEDYHQAQLLFFTNISHEFKTPLSLILGTLERIKQETGPMSERYFAILGNNAKRLLNLITELMSFQVVENGIMNLKISSTVLNDFVKNNAIDFEDYALQRNIDFKIILDPALSNPVFIDRNIVEKIIMNLLNNAFKYTTIGGSIEIETINDHSKFESKYSNNFFVNKNDQNSSMFGIIVRDTGIGISAESINQVFDRYYMVNDPKSESHLGSGIGLALVKSLVLLHKGYIAIYSERDKGTDIVVAFPSSKLKYTSLEFIDENNKEILFIETDKSIIPLDTNLNIDSNLNYKPEIFYLREKKHILLAEDNDDLRSLIKEALESDYEVCEASNGLVASELLKKKEIDLIISDIMMPEKDGVMFCREVKEDTSTSHIPFILMTAKGGLENRIEGIDSGADVYLEKPIVFKVLQLTIENLFKQQNRIKEFYAKNFYAENSEKNINQRENEFMKRLVQIIESKIDHADLDTNYLSVELAMSRSKLYAKVKSLTGKSIVEFIRFYRLRKAVRLLIDENMTIRDVMEKVGFESQSYFTRAFKNEFGENPGTYVSKAKQKLLDK